MASQSHSGECAWCPPNCILWAHVSAFLGGSSCPNFPGFSQDPAEWRHSFYPVHPQLSVGREVAGPFFKPLYMSGATHSLWRSHPRGRLKQRFPGAPPSRGLSCFRVSHQGLLPAIKRTPSIPVTLISSFYPVNSVGTRLESWSPQHHGPCRYQLYQKCQPSLDTNACLAQSLVRMNMQGGTR